ncbi:MAG: UDP-glucose 4-epimerase GalE [Catenulispora sp.]
MTWLVTGGAGYIGAHVVRALAADGAAVVVLDDMSTGSKERVPDDVPLVQGSVLDGRLVAAVLADHDVHGVVHLAGKKRVDESVAEPTLYYRENVEGVRVLLDAMAAADVRRLVFSSSAAVYGMTAAGLVDEDADCRPLSPYGQTKLIGEWLVRAQAQAHGLGYVNLRYFNVAGAGNADLGDRGAFNLVPMVFARLRAGRRPLVFGTDYPTPDGTCVRDYIHVADLAGAHAAAARRLDADPATGLTLNVGRGAGVSVLEVLAAVAAVTGADTTPEPAARRAGDPASVVAAADRIGAELSWHAEHDLASMVGSAWAAWQAEPGAGPEPGRS